MLSIFKIFQDLKNENPKNKEGFSIDNLPKIKHHKIGLSKNELPLFFIKCEDVSTQKVLDYNLESISIHFNQKCQLKAKDKKVTVGNYTIIALKTDSVDLQEYFLNIIYFVILKLPEISKLKELKIEVENLIMLFTKFSRPRVYGFGGMRRQPLHDGARGFGAVDTRSVSVKLYRCRPRFISHARRAQAVGVSGTDGQTVPQLLLIV